MTAVAGPMGPVLFQKSTPHHRRALRTGASLAALMLTAGPCFADDATGGNAQTPVQVPAISVEGAPAHDGSAASGYRVDTVTSVGPLGSMPVKDTPFSINVTSGELIENTDAHTLADALRTNPSVYTPQTPFSDARGMSDTLIRGFKPTYLRDGLYVNSYNMPSVENLDRIEVMNGLSGFLYGFVNPGGAVNYVAKEPTATNVASLKVGEYGGGQSYGDADLGGTLDDGKRLTYRLNVFDGGGGTYVDQQSYRNTLGSLKLDFQAAPDTVLKAHYYHNEFRENGAQVQFTFDPTKVNLPKAVDPTKLYGQSWTSNGVTSEQGGVGFDSKLNDTFTWRTDYNHSDMLWHRQTIRGNLVDNAGNYTESFRNYGVEHYTTDTAYSLLDANFKIGSVEHTVTFGYWGQNEEDRDAASSNTLLGTFNTAAPASVAQIGPAIGNTPTAYSGWFYNSAVLGDHVTFDKHWSALVGGNMAWDHERYEDLTSGVVTSSFTQSKLSPSLSLVYKPIPAVSTYVSYIEGLEGGDTAPSDAANANQLLPPSVSKQYEVGTKATLGNIDLATALFYIDKVNAELDPTDNVYKQDGREIHQGVEFNATGKLTDHLTAIGGVTFLDAHVSKATSDPLSQGRTPVDVPERQASAHLEYAIPAIPNLVASGGMQYLGQRPVDAHDTQFIDATAIFDAGLRYKPEIYGRPVTFNLNVSNLFDTRYWASYTNKSDSSGLQAGAPRLVAFSVKTEW